LLSQALLADLPKELRARDEVKLLEKEVDDRVCNIVQLIYDAKSYEGIAKDFEFSRRTMEEHWREGYGDVLRALGQPEVLQLPDRLEGVRTFDFARAKKKSDAVSTTSTDQRLK
jgi:NTE family protein